MNETELLVRLREEIPLEEASLKAERLFLAGLEDAPSGLGPTRHPMARWRGAGRPHLGWRLALTGGAAPGGGARGPPAPGGGGRAPRRGRGHPHPPGARVPCPR